MPKKRSSDDIPHIKLPMREITTDDALNAIYEMRADESLKELQKIRLQTKTI